jgi:hypothetical protein
MEMDANVAGPNVSCARVQWLTTANASDITQVTHGS